MRAISSFTHTESEDHSRDVALPILEMKRPRDAAAAGSTSTPAARAAPSTAASAPTISFNFIPPEDHLLHQARSRLPVVTAGEPIPAEPGFLRGHGTLVRNDGALVATVAGVVERVNKLISVRPLRSRYVGEVGDVLVGRVVEVGQKRWKVEVGGRQDALLMLSSINLPGGEQRRRTVEDQLNMRHFYVENDLVSAEIQAFFQDGSMSLHTRSLMYGKLTNGVLVSVMPTLMKRLKQHFHSFDFGVHCIFGMNGYIWVSARRPGAGSKQADGTDADAGTNLMLPKSPATPAETDGSSKKGTGSTPIDGIAAEDEQGSDIPPTLAERERVCRVRNALLALDRMCIAIAPTTVSEVYHASLSAGQAPKEMLLPNVMPSICKTALGHRAHEDPEHPVP